MRLHEHIGHDDLVGKLRMFPFVAWIGMVADVKPGPAIKAAGVHTANIIRRQIITELVSLVCAHPELVTSRTKCDPDGVSNSPCINFLPAAIGIEFENTSASQLRHTFSCRRAKK